MIMENDFTYFFDWQNFRSFDLQERMMAEFAENGAKNIVLISSLLERLINEPNFRMALKDSMKRMGLKFSGCHGIWGGDKDLACEDKQYFHRSIENHKLAIGYAADFGCKTYVVHVGAQCCYYRPYDEQKIRDLACKSLELLIPTAEKEGVIIAVENSYEPTNAADEVLYYIDKFPSPWVGACFDAGHANMLKSAGKEISKYDYEDMFRPWGNNIVFEDHTLEKMFPHIVTCHLHDNDGYRDLHQLPGEGTINWDEIFQTLVRCPRIQEMQVETCFPPHLSIRKVCTRMEQYKKYLQ